MEIVDKLGVVLAQIADLESQAKALKAKLVAKGDGAYEGALFRATVSSSLQERLDMAAVREHLSPQFITAHTLISPCTSVRVVSKNELRAALVVSQFKESLTTESQNGK